MYLAIKNLFQSDKTYVLIAEVAKLILIAVIKVNVVPIGFERFILFPITYYVHKSASKTNNRAEHLCETLKGTTRGTLHIRTFIP